MITANDYHKILEFAGLPIAGVSYANQFAAVNGWAIAPTAEQEAQAAQLLAAARIAEFAVNAQTVTVTTTPAAASIALLIGAETYDMPLLNGAGSVEIDFPQGVLSRTVRAVDQQTYGYSEITVNA